MHATRKLTLALSAIIPLALTGTSLAQSFSDASRSRASRTPPLSATAVRPAVISLEQQARLRRPGQIVRGDRVEESASMASALDDAADVQPLSSNLSPAPIGYGSGDAVHEPLIALHDGPIPSPSELASSEPSAASDTAAMEAAVAEVSANAMSGEPTTSESRTIASSAESINAMSEQTARDYPQEYATRQPNHAAAGVDSPVEPEPVAVVFENPDAPTLSTPSDDADMAAAMIERPSPIASPDEAPPHSLPAAPLERPTQAPITPSSSAVRIEDVTAWSAEERAQALSVHEPDAAVSSSATLAGPAAVADMPSEPAIVAPEQMDATPTEHEVASLPVPAPVPAPVLAPETARESAPEPIEIAVDDLPEMMSSSSEDAAITSAMINAPVSEPVIPEPVIPEPVVADPIAAEPVLSEPRLVEKSAPEQPSASASSSTSLDAMIDSIVGTHATGPSTSAATPAPAAAPTPIPATAPAVAPSPTRIVSTPAVAPASASAAPSPVASSPVASSAAASSSSPSLAGNSSVRPPVIDPLSGQPTRIVSTPAPMPVPAPVSSAAAVTPEVTPTPAAPVAVPVAPVASVNPVIPESTRAVREPVIPLDRPVVNQPALNQPALNQPALNQPALNQPALNQPALNQSALDQPVLDPRELTWRQSGARVRVVQVNGSANNAQWRLVHGAGDGAWLRLREGDELNGEVEVRTGVGASVQLDVDGRTQVEVDRLTRAQITRAVPSKGVAAAGVQLDRGRVVVRPSTDPANADLSPARRACLARVQTPDQLVDVRTQASIEYSAFVGTRQAAAE